MSYSVNVPEIEVNEVVQWAESAVLNDATDHEDGTYEQGVYDALMWALGYIQSRPDHG